MEQILRNVIMLSEKEYSTENIVSSCKVAPEIPQLLASKGHCSLLLAAAFKQGEGKVAENLEAPLSALDNIARDRCIKRVDSHPGQHLFTLLPSGRRYCSIACRTNRLKNSFYPWAVRLLNGK
ncbi:hypothetical protein JRQ81_015798 [Phrynocephalus forsythii]|uniref:Uncharacterized protein n=1 Tax=Phrynocephalus forsythii TaxID=171643 RepID=A0A9Q0XWK3_9SAUR|nr:hypothetical protein JRQ81_015798 [Phrynocephalus forsythii]